MPGPTGHVYWLVALPQRLPPGTKVKLREHTSIVSQLKRDCARNTAMFQEVAFPHFRVAKFDLFYDFADELQRADITTSTLIRRMARQVQEAGTQRGRLGLTGGPTGVANDFSLLHDATWSVHNDLRGFEWNQAQFSLDTSIPELLRALLGLMHSTETSYTALYTLYQQARGAYTTAERDSQASLLTRALDSVVVPEKHWFTSPFLRTALILVPKAQANDIDKTYIDLCDHVIPGTLHAIDTTSDPDHHLYSVVLTKKHYDVFKANCQAASIIVREYDPNASAARHTTPLPELKAVEQEKWNEYCGGATVYFRTMYRVFLHIKTLRAFVESTLRFGTTNSFTPVMICLQDARGTETKLLKTLHTYFPPKTTTTGTVDAAIMSLVGTESDAPFVCITIDLDLEGK